MTRKKILSLFTVTIALGLMALITSPAKAVFVLSLNALSTGVGVVDVVVMDQAFAAGVATGTAKGPTTGADLDLNPGIMEFKGAVGGFFVNVALGFSKPLLGSPTLAEIDLFSAQFTIPALGGFPDKVTLMLTDTGYGLNGQPFLYSFISSIGGTTDGTVTSEAFIDPANAAFGMAISNGLHSHTSLPSGFSFNDASVVALGAGPFSLSWTVMVDHLTSGGSTTLDANSKVTIIPEPATFTIWACLAGIGLAGAGWRKRRMKKAA